MIIKKRFKFSKKFFFNIFHKEYDRNYVYWIEDNKGNKLSDEFRVTGRQISGPFLILTESIYCAHIIFRDTANDTLYVHGELSIMNLDGWSCIHNPYKMNDDLLFNSKHELVLSNFTLKSLDARCRCFFLIQNGALQFISPSIGKLNTIANLSGSTNDLIYNIAHTYNFNGEFIGVFEDKSKALLDTSGHMFSRRLHYDKIYPLNHDFYFVKNKNSGIGLVDSKGKVIIKPKYQYAKPVSFNPNWIVLKRLFSYGVIDTSGKIIVNFDASEIIELDKKLVIRKDFILKDSNN